MTLAVSEVLAALDVNSNNVDLFLDAESLDQYLLKDGVIRNLKKIVCDSLGKLDRQSFRTIVFCGSSVPENVGPEYNTEPYRTERIELNLWKSLVSEPSSPMVFFGDYAVIHPFQPDSDKPVRPPSRIRLSTATEHVFYRGPRANHRRLCSMVMESPAADGQSLSWGLAETKACGRGSGGTGRPTDWVALDTNAHVETTVSIVDRHLRDYKRFELLRLSQPEKNSWLQETIELE